MRNNKVILVILLIIVIGIGSVSASRFFFSKEDSDEPSTVYLQSNLDLTQTEFVFVIDDADHHHTHILYLLPGTYQYRAEVDGFFPITGTLQVGEEDQLLNLYFAKSEVIFVSIGRQPVWSPDGNWLAYGGGGGISFYELATSYTEWVELPFEALNYFVHGWASDKIVILYANNATWAVVNRGGAWQTEKISEGIVEWSSDFSTGILASEAVEIGLASRQNQVLSFDQYNAPRNLHSIVVSATGKYIAGIVPQDVPELGFLIDGLLQVYSSEAGAYVYNEKDTYAAFKLEFSPCENYLAYLVSDEEGEHLVIHHIANSTSQKLKNAGLWWEWSDCGKQLLWVQDTTIVLENLASGQQTHLLELDDTPINLAYVDENRFAYTVNGCLYVYDLVSHENQLIDDNAVDYVSVSPAQNMLAYVADGHIAIAKLPPR